jgi:hypothetical protein
MNIVNSERVLYAVRGVNKTFSFEKKKVFVFSVRDIKLANSETKSYKFSGKKVI